MTAAAAKAQPLLVEVIRLGGLLAALGSPRNRQAFLTVPGNPLPQERARSGKGGRHYTPKRTREAQEDLALQLLPLKLANRGTWRGNLSLAVIFYRDTQVAVDADNLLKLLKDAATNAQVWRDDKQVTGCAAVVELDRENPRTVIALADHESTLRRDPAPVK